MYTSIRILIVEGLLMCMFMAKTQISVFWLPCTAAAQALRYLCTHSSHAAFIFINYFRVSTVRFVIYQKEYNNKICFPAFLSLSHCSEYRKAAESLIPFPCSQHGKQKTFLSFKFKAQLNKDIILFRTCFILLR